MDARSTQTLLEQMYQYVEYGVRRAKHGGTVAFELRIPATQVFGVYQLLCDSLNIQAETGPYLEHHKKTLQRVQEVLTQKPAPSMIPGGPGRRRQRRK